MEASELSCDCSHFADGGAEVPGQEVRRLGRGVSGSWEDNPGGWPLGQDLCWAVCRLRSGGWGLDSRSGQPEVEHTSDPSGRRRKGAGRLRPHFKV